MAALPSAQAQQVAQAAATPAADETGLGLLGPAAQSVTAFQAAQGDPTAQATLAAQNGGDTSGLMALMAQQQQAEPQIAPALMQRPNQQDARTPEEKMAAISQTPNVYIDRLRRRT
jgi:hypothetical protein